MTSGRDRRSVRRLPFVPTEAKLRPSVRPAGLVVRGALVDRLSEGPRSGVVVVSAPPGYGKTVLASQWAEEDPRPFAWVTVDEGDNDPRVLVAYVVLALHRVEPVAPAVLAALADDRPAAFAEALLPQLARMLAGRRPAVLVLDGVEALTDARSLEVLHVLGTSLPEDCQLVLVGRAAPAVDWSTLESEGRLVSVGVDELRLSRADAVALVRATGLTLSGDDLDVLLARTEGWAAGVYLAALSLAADVQHRTGPEAVTGSDSLIAGYLSEELMVGLSPEQQAFLLRTSTLDELSASLCDAVLDTTGSAAVLEQLADANVLLARLEGTDRYHVQPLLTEALRAALARDKPRLVPVLHRRASLWFERHDDAERAIDHAVAGQDLASAARLVWDQVGGCLGSGQVSRLEAWLGRFPARQVAAHAKLALTAAWCNLERGRAADHWIGLAEHGRYEADRKGEPTSVAAATALLRAVVARNGIAQMAADAQLALDLDALDPPLASIAELLLALSTYLSGRLEEGRSALERVQQLSRESGAHQSSALALGELALLAADEQEWEQASALSQSAVAELRRHGLDEIPLLAPVHCAAALVAAHLAPAHAATPVVQRAFGLFSVAAEPPLWQGMQCREVLARAELALGDTAGARTLLSEAQALLSETDDEPLRDRVEHTWRQVAGRPLEVSPGATLTRAEMRVLQLLPTHLSFAQIGQQLFVSRNTVKTQAVSAYRKLGVGSRSEAVARARAMGLLPQDGAAR